MLHRTLLSAQQEPGPFASWKSKSILWVQVAGRHFWRTYTFDASYHKCKRCRGAGNQNGRIMTSGVTCDRCGNPFAGMTRQLRTKRSGRWETVPQCYASSGRAH